MDISRARFFISKSNWVFAKTMPQWPHWYVHLTHSGVDPIEFQYLNKLIDQYGYTDSWNGKNPWHYLVIDEFKYWNCGCDDIINRAEPISNREMIERGKLYIRNNRIKKD